MPEDAGGIETPGRRMSFGQGNRIRSRLNASEGFYPRKHSQHGMNIKEELNAAQ